MKKMASLMTSELLCADNLDVLTGINYKMTSKAAVMYGLSGYAVGKENVLLKILLENEKVKEKYLKKDGFGVSNMMLDEEDLEDIFNLLRIGKNFDASKHALTHQIYARVVELNGEVLYIDSMGYLVYGIMKSERCILKLKESMINREDELYAEYRKSDYDNKEILNMFLQSDKMLAVMLIGLICKARKDEKDYALLMDIIYAGYRRYKNTVKRLDTIEFNDFRDVVTSEEGFLCGLAKAVVFLLAAQDLKKKVRRDMELCVFIYTLWNYRTYFSNEPEKNGLSETGMRRKKKLSKKYNLYSFYDNYYNKIENLPEDGITDISQDEQIQYYENSRTLLESIFERFHLNLRAFESYTLDETEVNTLCEILSQNNEDNYIKYLFVSTLCKYVKELENKCIEISGEEQNYRELCHAEQDFLKLHEEYENEKEQIIRSKKQLLDNLFDLEKENDKLKDQLEKVNQDSFTEKQELIALRNYVYQMENGEFTEESYDCDPEREEKLKNGKVVVVGGHSNWQKKIKNYLKTDLSLDANSKNFNPAIIKGADYIIINTNILKHACYYRVISQKDEETRILYAGNNNIELCVRELVQQMG